MMNDSTSETSHEGSDGAKPPETPPPGHDGASAPLPLAAVFDGVSDSRRSTRNKLHRLGDILMVANCAVIGGTEFWEAIAEYGRTKEAFFRRFLPLDNGIPTRTRSSGSSPRSTPGRSRGGSAVGWRPRARRTG